MDDSARRWHEQNRMPKNPTAQQRVEWHLEHAQHCACRPIPAGVLTLIKELGLPLPAQQRARN
jgi:hypothetical protein